MSKSPASPKSSAIFKATACMLLSLGLVNLWNRLHVATGQVAEPAKPAA